MTVTVANLPYDFCPTASARSNQGFLFKNAYDAWFYNNATATATQITDVDYPGYHTYSIGLTSSSTTATATINTKSISGITRSGDVATATCTAHGLITGDTPVISGATQTEYNGTITVTAVPTADTFTYDVSGTPATPATGTILLQPYHGLSVGDSFTVAGATPSAYNGTYTVKTVPSSTTFTYTFAGGTSPATGTITAVGGAVTVPGIVFIDNYFVVMTTTAKIVNFDLNSGSEVGGLDYIVAEIEPGAGVALGKSQNYVIAFKEWSTEFFFDNANAVGSPLSPVQNGFSLIGCASGASVTNLDGILFWVSQTKQKGRGVYLMEGLQQVQISTPDIERILNLSTLATVHSFGAKIAGHAFYVLTLVDQDITLVYDMTTKIWCEWSSLTLGTPVSVTSITLSGTTATVTATAHGITDGDPVLIAGANQAAYNGIKVATYVSSSVFTFETTAGTTTPATGTITSTPYTETYFKFTKYIHAFGKDLVQHESNGTLCELTEASYQDVGIPVNLHIRTAKIDNGNTAIKRHGSAEIIGHKVSANAYMRYTGDDYVTFSKYRKIDLDNERSRVTRLGADRRRSYEIRHLDNTSLQVAAIELDVN